MHDSTKLEKRKNICSEQHCKRRQMLLPRCTTHLTGLRRTLGSCPFSFCSRFACSYPVVRGGFPFTWTPSPFSPVRVSRRVSCAPSSFLWLCYAGSAVVGRLWPIGLNHRHPGSPGNNGTSPWSRGKRTTVCTEIVEELKHAHQENSTHLQILWWYLGILWLLSWIGLLKTDKTH